MSIETLEAEKAELRKKYYLDPVAFMQEVLSDWFYQPLTWMHRGYLAILLRRTDFLPKYGELDKIIKNFVYKNDPWDANEVGKPLFCLEADGTLSLTISRNTEIMMPRGIGKTTLANGAHIFIGAYKIWNFVLKIGETINHAQTQLMNCRKQFEFNNKLAWLFGEMKGKGSWAQDEFQLANGFVMAATGRGGQVRGRNVDGRRPDFIHLDDVEDQESVSTPEQRAKTLSWFMGDVMPALGRLQNDCTILLNGTLLHNEALLVKLGKDPTFTTIVLSVLDADGEPVFPAYMSHEKIAREKETYIRQGLLDRFYLEYFNQLVNEDTMQLPPSLVKREVLERPIARALAHDPAISKKKSADEAAFAVVGLYPAGHFQIEYVEGFRGMTPQEARDKFFALRRLWSEPEIPFFCGLETVAYQEALYDLITEKMAANDDYFQLEKLKFNQEKKARILGQLQPRYRAGLLHHRREFPVYESEMREFPAGHDDQLDVVAMALSMLQPLYAAASEKIVDSSYDSVSYYDSEAGESGGL